MSVFEYGRFLMFGDSITEFSFAQYPIQTSYSPELAPTFSLGSALTHDYTRKLQILQRGFSGYNSTNATNLLAKLLKVEHDSRSEGEKIRLAYIFFGTNDARLVGSQNNKQHVPLEKFIENIQLLIDEFQKRDIKVIIVTPALHNQQMWNETHPDDLKSGDLRSNEINLSYVNALVKLTAKINIPLVNLYEIFIESGFKQEDLLTDGVHFNGLGYQLFYQNLLKTIKDNYPDLHPDALPYKFPHWSLLDYSTTFD